MFSLAQALREIQCVPSPDSHCPVGDVHHFWALLLVPGIKHTPVLIRTDSLASLLILRSGCSRTVHLDRLSRVTWQLVSRRARFLAFLYITHTTPLLPPKQFQCTGGSIIRRFCHLDRVVHQQHRLRDPPPPHRVHSPDRPIRIGPFMTTRCDVYMSPCPDPHAVAVDAFYHCWDGWRTLYLSHRLQ